MDIKKYIKKINGVSPFILLAIGFAIGVIISYLYFQPKINEWINNYNNAYEIDMPKWGNIDYKSGHLAGCVDGLVVSGVFMSGVSNIDQSKSLIMKIATEKITNPDQANIDQEQLDNLDTTYKNQQKILNNCEN